MNTPKQHHPDRIEDFDPFEDGLDEIERLERNETVSFDSDSIPESGRMMENRIEEDLDDWLESQIN